MAQAANVAGRVSRLARCEAVAMVRDVGVVSCM